MKRLCLSLLCGAWSFTTLEASSGDRSVGLSDSLRVVEKTWLFGGGVNHLLDTYLSPENYIGGMLNVMHHTERKAHFGQGHWKVNAHYALSLSHVETKNKERDAWDVDLTAGVGVLRQWSLSRHWSVAVGPSGEGALGATYMPANGNNPGQAKGYLHVGATAEALCTFRVGKQKGAWRIAWQLPLIGMGFAPEYGASYYEMFDVDKEGSKWAWLTPKNAPSTRLTTMLTLPLCKAKITVGYCGRIWQQQVHHLKQHVWQHSVMIGYTRRIHILR